MRKILILILCSPFLWFSLKAEDTIPEKGTVFNESEWKTDSITGRKLLKLTKNRDYNQTPTYHINTGFHGATDLSPVNLAASIHFNTAVNNFGIQEYMPHQDVVYEVFKINYKFENGFLTIDDTPGIGVEIDEKKAEKYPYVMARLPVNRKTDGTMFNW